MSVAFDRGSPGKFDSRTLSRELLVDGLGVYSIPVCVMSKCKKHTIAIALAGMDQRERIYIYIYIVLYIHIWRERERETYTYM